jgi:chromosome partitioning protein
MNTTPKPAETLAFFNNKGGVGKTSLVYHLAWTCAGLGVRVLMADLDPQSNLTAMCLTEERLEALWPDDGTARKTIRGSVQPIVDGIGDIAPAHIEPLDDSLGLIPGDILLAEYEQRLSDAWPRTMDSDPAAFRVATSFHRAIREAAQRHDAQLVLIDVGPNLGAINRAALIAADYVITPVGADLFSVQGLRNLGPALEGWRNQWQQRLRANPIANLDVPQGRMEPIGYVVMQPNLYGGRVTRAYDRWLKRLPGVYAERLLKRSPDTALSVANDAYALGVLKHYRSLMPLAQDARKPIFRLTAADGAIGAHWAAVQQVGKDFRDLLEKIAGQMK